MQLRASLRSTLYYVMSFERHLAFTSTVANATALSSDHSPSLVLPLTQADGMVGDGAGLAGATLGRGAAVPQVSFAEFEGGSSD